MKVAALVSGGKDSILALHCAQTAGWDVTHLVTMRPLADDSWMFHVPNTRWAPLISEATGIPLLVVETAGEKEAELADLQQALGALEVDGFVSGALASEYQRTRLERIGHKLGLKSFTPLWHKTPAQVLATVAHPAWDVRFAAVAAEGLDETWLGRRVTSEAVTDLQALHERHGIHVAGEGGEYETLVLDAPCYQKRIHVRSSQAKWHRDGGTWQVDDAILQEKSLYT